MTRQYRSKRGVDVERKAHPDEHYVTPISVAYYGLLWYSALAINTEGILYPSTILDPCMGDYGPFGAAARKVFPGSIIFGADVRDCKPPIAYYDRCIPGAAFEDLQERITYKQFALIISNIPFGEFESFVRRGLSTLLWGGALMYLLPLNFFASKKRYNGLFREYPPTYALVLTKRPSWQCYDPEVNPDKRRATNPRNYAFFIWHRTSLKALNRSPMLNPATKTFYLDWDYEESLERGFVRDNGLDQVLGYNVEAIKADSL